MRKLRKMNPTSITKAEVLQEIVDYLKRKNISIPVNGINVVPNFVEELTPEAVHYNSKLYKTSYTRLYNRIKRGLLIKPVKTKKTTNNNNDLFNINALTKTGITETKILQEIVDFLKKHKVFVVRKGKSIIPQCIDDLPPSLTLSNGVQYSRAYQRLYAVIKRAKKEKVNDVELFTKPTPIATPKLDAKPVATPVTQPKLEAKKLVVNLSDTMTCTITSDGLITVDFK